MSDIKKRSTSSVPSTSEKSSDVTPEPDDPWNIIIINQVPEGLDDEELISLFSQYGKIENTYWNEKIVNYYRRDRTARITFSTEEEASNVFQASKNKLIKYHDEVLMITQVSNNYCPIENLPDICLRRIFEHLDKIEDKFRVEMVCKRWKDNGRCSWSNITKIWSWDWKINTWRVIIPRIGRFLQVVKIFESEYFWAVAEDCVKIKELECHLTECDYAPVALPISTILQKNLNLRQFKLGIHDCDNLTMNFMEDLPAELESINIYIANFSRETFPAGVTLSKFQNLRDLHLHNVDINDHQSIDGVMNLEKLSLLFCKIPDSILLQILENNKDLKYLNLDPECESICLQQRLQQLSKLQVFVISSDDSIDALLGCLPPSLRGLFCICPTITDRGLRNFFDSASDIEKVEIYECPSITMQSLVIAREWTERTGKSLIVLSDNLDVLYEFNNKGFKNTELFKVSSWRYVLYYDAYEEAIGSELLE